MAKSSSAANAMLQMEVGQEFRAMAAMNTLDKITFTNANNDDLFSGKEGYDVVVCPNGVLTGGVITPKTGTNDTVTVAMFNANLNGELFTSVGGDIVITRGSVGDTYKINSITVTAAGTLAVVSGTVGDAFSSTRGAAGGPPLIPVDSIELGWVRTTSETAAVISSDEIRQISGESIEYAEEPTYDVNYEGGTVKFISALPAIHTGNTSKKVFIQYYVPIFAELYNVTDFKAPETSYSVSSTAVYGGAIASESASLSQGGFTIYLASGVRDTIIKEKGNILWYKFFPSKYVTDYLICQGRLGITRNFPASGGINGACTISASSAAKEVY